jgi:hypothetical protein
MEPRNRLAVVAGALLAVPAWGCMEVHNLIRVKGDGSGTLVQTITMNPQALEMAMGGMAKAMGGTVETKGTETSGDLTSSGPFAPEKLKAEASKLGEGVTFVSAEPIDLKDRKGARATFAFKDVTRLQLSQKPDAPQGAPESPSPEDRLKFRFERQPAGRSVLIVDMGQPGPASPRPARQPAAETPPEALEMVKSMFKGMRINIAVEVEGTGIKTNSPYLEGSTVTLLDVSFDAILADPKKLKQFEAMDGAPMDEIKRLVKGMPGIKVNTDPQVRIEFSPR